MSDSDLTLPLDGWHRERGGRMVPFAGYQMPVQFEGIMAEHRWTRSSAGLFDVSHMGQIRISGDRAEVGLESLLPADLAILKPGRPKYSLLVNDNGGIIDDLMITRRSDHFYLVVNGATKTGDLEHLQRRLPAGIVVEHMTDHALLALQGPRAVDVLSRLVPEVCELTFMTAGEFSLAGVPAWISRSGYTGEDGFEISVASEAAEAIATRLADDPEVRPIGLGARDSLRLEAGLPLYGHDLDDKTTPVEADLLFAISKRRREQGGYPGAERIGREIADGPLRRRVGFRIDGRQPVREGAEVIDGDGVTVGRVTSGGFAPSLELSIAMGYVPTAMAVADTSVQLIQRGRVFTASVVPMPFVPHRYHRKGASK